MLRFLLVGLFVTVFVSLPSVRTDDELTEKELLKAVERALDGQIKDREVRTTDASDVEELVCQGNQDCKDCFAVCDDDEQCAINCVLRIGQDGEDKQDKQGSGRKRWFGGIAVRLAYHLGASFWRSYWRDH
ncbi:uncharacterized protein LOC128220429 [Mya arenaria]|uniref:uncharacterized protein LOC128220429 n=1 Tax=Mya arenaria TaxID=6604 RepID=UPI0022E6E5DF|nr:uncharacterized protein LOC128220429 [Mya arenaria]